MMTKIYIKNTPLILLFFLFFYLPAFAQLGGKQTFSFLHLAPNARVLGLGGVNLTSDSRDVGMFFTNPALVDSANDNNLQINVLPMNVGATFTTFAFQKNVSSTRFLRAGIQYLGYGTFDGYDLVGNSTGSFSASDYALTLSYAHRISPFTLGANLKIVGSSIGNLSSFGLLADVAAAFIHPKKDLRIGLGIKNFGFAFSNYTDLSQFSMPFDAQIGISFRPEKMPLRFSFTAHQLATSADVVYNDPNQRGVIDASGNEIRPTISLFDRVSRRMVVGVEMVASKNFNLRFGYNFLRRQELAVENRRALVGFSFGFMFRIKGIEFAYSRSIQHLSGGINAFSLTANTQGLFKKKKVVE
jgi:hypothetical protein